MAKKTNLFEGLTPDQAKRAKIDLDNVLKSGFSDADTLDLKTLGSSQLKGTYAKAIVDAYNEDMQKALKDNFPKEYAQYETEVLSETNMDKRKEKAIKFAVKNKDFYVKPEDIIKDKDELSIYQNASNIYNQENKVPIVGTGSASTAVGSRTAARDVDAHMYVDKISNYLPNYKAKLDLKYDKTTKKFSKSLLSGSVEYPDYTPGKNETEKQQPWLVGGDPKQVKNLSGTLQNSKTPLQPNEDNHNKVYNKTSGQWENRGIKTSTPVTASAKEVQPMVDLSTKKGKLKHGIDYTKPPKLMTGADYTQAGMAVGQVGGAMFDTFDEQKYGKTSVGGAALKGAAAGAAAGSVVGPWGTAVGGVIGGAAGGISAAVGNKKIDAKIKADKAKYLQAEKLSHFMPLKNTQAQMYAMGVSAANMSKPVEVEKDELVLRQDVQGKYVKKADFSGGRSHAQGGEPYTITKGDVVFPAKKKDVINKALAQGADATIDAERKKLPKDVIVKAEDGVDYLKPKGIDTAQLAKDMVTASIPKGKTTEGFSGNLRSSPAETTKPSPSLNWTSAADYVQPLGNLIKGMQRPERVERRTFTPETVSYTDKSAGLRQEAAIADRIRRGNTTTSAQQNRANANVSSAMKSRDMQNITAHEVGREDQIAAANTDIINKAKQTNIGLENMYDEQNQQNIAAIQRYTDQGLADFTRVAQQQRRDKGLENSQNILLNNLDTNNFEYSGTDGVVYKMTTGGVMVDPKTGKPKPANVTVVKK